MIIKQENAHCLDFAKGDGLLPAIAQHALTGEILMVAWMSRESLNESLNSQDAVFYSRSRQKLWRKGETSGNALKIKDILTDCDRDTLLLRVLPAGPACHTGARSCFLAGDDKDDAAMVLAPSFLDRLQLIIDDRLTHTNQNATNQGIPSESYTVKLASRGVKRIAQKVGEEGLETALAGATGDRHELRDEAADLLFHLLVLLRHQGLSLSDVLETLAARHDLTSTTTSTASSADLR